MLAFLTANGTSDPVRAEHTGEHAIDIDFVAGVTANVKILSRPIGGVFKPERNSDDSADLIVTTSRAYIVSGNREYAIQAASFSGSGSITLTLTEVEAP